MAGSELRLSTRDIRRKDWDRGPEGVGYSASRRATLNKRFGSYRALMADRLAQAGTAEAGLGVFFQDVDRAAAHVQQMVGNRYTLLSPGLDPFINPLMNRHGRDLDPAVDFTSLLLTFPAVAYVNHDGQRGRVTDGMDSQILTGFDALSPLAMTPAFEPDILLPTAVARSPQFFADLEIQNPEVGKPLVAGYRAVASELEKVEKVGFHFGKPEVVDTIVGLPSGDYEVVFVPKLPLGGHHIEQATFWVPYLFFDGEISDPVDHTQEVTQGYGGIDFYKGGTFSHFHAGKLSESQANNVLHQHVRNVRSGDSLGVMSFPFRYDSDQWTYVPSPRNPVVHSVTFVTPE